MKIYLVMGEQGSYSDRSCWPVKSFLTQDSAEEFVKEVTKEKDRVVELNTKDDDYLYWTDRVVINSLDSNTWANREDSTWSVAEIELVSK